MRIMSKSDSASNNLEPSASNNLEPKNMFFGETFANLWFVQFCSHWRAVNVHLLGVGGYL